MCTLPLPLCKLWDIVIFSDRSEMKNFRPVPYNEGPRDWQSLFAIPRICCIRVLFQPFYYCWVKKIVSYTEDFVVYRGSTVLNQDIDITCCFFSFGLNYIFFCFGIYVIMLCMMTSLKQRKIKFKPKLIV